jgi:hypothetical protein
MPIKIGTGFFDLINKNNKISQNSFYFERKLIFDDDDYHEPFNFEIDPKYFE